MDNKIQLGLYTANTVPAIMVDNVANILLDLAYSDNLYIERPTQHIISSRIDGARNVLIDNFLKETTASHLFIMDADMRHPPMMPRMLLSREKEVISGLYFHRKPGNTYPHFYKHIGEKEDARPGYRNDINWSFSPMLKEAYDFFSTLNEEVLVGNKPLCIVGQGGVMLEHSVVEIDGGGFGCLLISREAIEKLSPPYLEDEPGLNGDFPCISRSMRGVRGTV